MAVDYFRVNVKADAPVEKESLTMAMYVRGYTKSDATNFLTRQQGIYVQSQELSSGCGGGIRCAYLSTEPEGYFPDPYRSRNNYLPIPRRYISVLSAWRVYAVPRLIVTFAERYTSAGYVTAAERLVEPAESEQPEPSPIDDPRSECVRQIDLTMARFYADTDPVPEQSVGQWWDYPVRDESF